MMKFLFTSVFLHLILMINGQCVINELSVTPGECNQSGKFYVSVNFNHTGTSEKFKIQGNGVNYGTFNYSALPVTIGPLNADCVTNYEFVVRDDINQDCFAFKNPGKKCCENNCTIAFDNVETGDCHGSNYQLYFDLNYNAPDNGFDLFTNGHYFGHFQYSQLPLNLEEFPSSSTESFNSVVVCANDNASCCDTIMLLNPCICSIYKVQGQVIDCNEETDKFSLRLNFKHNLTSDSFQVGGNSINYGKFAYSDLPITLTDLSFSNSTEYEFLIVDKNDAFCFGSFELGKVTKCDFECGITNLTAKPTKCEDGLFYVDIAFDHKNTGLDGFIIRGNGVIYGNYEYGEPNYRIGPLEGNCEKLYEFVVRDKELEGCSATIHFTEPVCCDSICKLSELTVTEHCENNVLKAFTVNFNHTGTSSKFLLKINNTVIGTYPYSSLPLKITNLNFDIPNVVIRIFDSENESCNLVKEYKFLCSRETTCSIYDLNVKISECNDHGKFYAIIKFKVSNPASEKFIVKVNGLAFDTLPYGHELYEIGPLAGDCSTLYKFLVQDFIRSDCADDYVFTEKVCCNGECKISEPVISFSACQEGKFNLQINFKHVNTLLKFRVKLNGVTKGPFNYADLPILIENLNEKQSYEIIVWDVEKEACRLTFTIPAIECPSGTKDDLLTGLTLFNDNQKVQLTVGESSLPAQITLSDLTGKRLLTMYADVENTLDISTLPAGLYFIQISHQQKWITKRFIKY